MLLSYCNEVFICFTMKHMVMSWDSLLKWLNYGKNWALINIHGPIVIIHSKHSIVLLLILWWSILILAFWLIDWISMSHCSYVKICLIGLINIWFPVERLPPSSLLLSSFLCLAWEWENGKSAQWISSGWLGLSLWTPVDPGCQMCLSIGVSSRICLLGLRGFVGVDRRCRRGCRTECCPSLGPATHTVFFSIHHCQ